MSKVEERAEATFTNTVNLQGQLTRVTPQVAFKWNYLTCGAPVFSQMGSSGDGVLADGDKISAIFPGPNGEMYPATGCSVGAFTVVGKYPAVYGALATPDVVGTTAGLDVQMDRETANNVGLQLILGAGPLGGASAITVGTHGGYIDVTLQTPDWSDFDCVAIGYRKIEDFETTLNGIVAAGSAADMAYTDIVAFGCGGDTNLKIMTDKNNSGTSTATDCGASVPVDDQNLRMRVSVTSAGVVTYSFVVNAVAGAGTLAAPATTAAVTFDDGDVIVPYIATLGAGTGTDLLVIKDIEVKKSPGTSYTN
jgi:hypothetical protein